LRYPVTTGSRPSYRIHKKWPKNVPGIFSKLLQNPRVQKSHKKLLEISKNPIILKALGELSSKFCDVRNLSVPSHAEPVRFELSDRHARNARLRVKPLTDTVRGDQNIANIANITFPSLNLFCDKYTKKP